MLLSVFDSIGCLLENLKRSLVLGLKQVYLWWLSGPQQVYSNGKFEQHICASLLGDTIVFFLCRKGLAFRVTQLVVIVYPHRSHMIDVSYWYVLTHCTVLHRVSTLNLCSHCLIIKLIITVFNHRAHYRRLSLRRPTQLSWHASCVYFFFVNRVLGGITMVFSACSVWPWHILYMSPGCTIIISPTTFIQLFTFMQFAYIARDCHPTFLALFFSDQ